MCLRAYKKTGVFPDGTVFYKELQLTLPGENSGGSRTEPSGRGYFPGALNGADDHGEGLQAVWRDRRLGLLRLQSLRTKTGFDNGSSEVGMRLLPYRQRKA